jgi:tyrosinase
MWLFEKALDEECGYKGAFPYWNWGTTSAQPYPSYIFNDGEYGLSGDGEYVPHNLNGTHIIKDVFVIPFEQNGGGCVKTGPFAK